MEYNDVVSDKVKGILCVLAIAVVSLCRCARIKMKVIFSGQWSLSVMSKMYVVTFYGLYIALISSRPGDVSLCDVRSAARISVVVNGADT